MIIMNILNIFFIIIGIFYLNKMDLNPCIRVVWWLSVVLSAMSLGMRLFN